MKSLTATYRIVTPMFIGGADQTPNDGIRPPSVKGALRFWWRALNWGKHWQESNGNEEKALRCLHAEEARLFGSSMDGDSGGQGCFLLTVRSYNIEDTKTGKVHQQFAEHDASRYLCYGLMGAFGANAGRLDRGCLNEHQSFEVKLIFKNEIETSIKDAVTALGLLGGLGSRVRHGLGSLSLESLVEEGKNVWKKPENSQSYIQQTNKLLRNKLQANGTSPFTCFDTKSRIEILNTAETPFKALNIFAKALMMYRSAGHNGRVLGKKTEQNFKNDHDWKYRSNQRNRRWNPENLPNDFHPQRAVFGLPHNYGQGTHLSVTPATKERRSSPLFLHIHHLNNTAYIAVSIFLPSLFLPENEKINAGGREVNSKISYNFITDFLDGADKNNQMRFPDKEEVLMGSQQ